MKVLVTGAGGFIGSRLVDLLQRKGEGITALALADQKLASVPSGALAIEGDLGAPESLRRVADFAPDVCFHLAAIPGGASEADYAAGRRINLDTTLALFETLARKERPPVVVYASSIAVYGSTLPPLVTPDTPLHPAITYGAHKRTCEILLADFTRRGLLDGRSLRLPGIVARPGAPAGLASAFMGNVILALAAGERYTCPVAPTATAWWMSSWRCAENLLHASRMAAPAHDIGRAWPLPVLRLSIAEVVDTLASLYGDDRRDLVDYAPQPMIEAVYGRYPVLDDSTSRAMGLTDDGTPEAMVRRALATTYEQ